jgi:hypothetical protein
MHLAELPLYERDLLQSSDAPRSFHAAPEYDGWQTNDALYSWLVASLRDKEDA